MRRFLLPAAAFAVVLPSLLVAQDKELAQIEKAIPEKAPAKPKQPRNLLVFSKTAGFRHGSIPTGIRAVTLMGDKTGAYTAFATEDESYFEPAKLAKFDAVLMLNTTGECFRPKGVPKEEADKREAELKQSLVDFVKGGKGLIGFHSATDTYKNWDEYNDMMGGAFVSHPWGANSTVGVKNLDPDSPINAAFGGKGFTIQDEIYQFRDDTAKAGERRYLLALDKDKTEMKNGKRKDGTYPIAWIDTYGKGRVFYCSLGHRNEIYWNPAVMAHYLAGIQYALGDLDADATPAK